MGGKEDDRKSQNSISFGQNSKVSIGQLSIGDNNTVSSTTYQFTAIQSEPELAQVISHFARFLRTRPHLAAEAPALLNASSDLVAQFVALARAFIASNESLPGALVTELRGACAALGISDRWLENN